MTLITIIVLLLLGVGKRNFVEKLIGFPEIKLNY